MDKKDYLIIIGKNITEIRKRQGLSTNKLANLCEIEKSNLIPIEKGRINVTIKTLIKISEALNVGLQEILNFD